MKASSTRVVPVSLLLTLGVPSVAWGHVVVEPGEVEEGGHEELTASVPTEERIPTRGVRVEVPEGFTVLGVEPVPGWGHEPEERSGPVTAVTWSGGRIPPGESQRFALRAEAPDEPGRYPWKAVQTHEDSSVVEWTGPPNSEQSAPAVEVVPADAEAKETSGPRDHHADEEHGPDAGTATLAGTGRPAPALYGLLAVAALAAGPRPSSGR